jgi:acyl-coenzyme A thioesterase PaaI-like protein
MCHGGMLATFADMLIPCAAMYQKEMERRFLPTISLQIDYMGAAPLGAWVQGEADVLRTTRNMLFGQGLVTADGEPALRVSGIFKIGQMIGDGKATDPLALK